MISYKQVGSHNAKYGIDDNKCEFSVLVGGSRSHTVNDDGNGRNANRESNSQNADVVSKTLDIAVDGQVRVRLILIDRSNTDWIVKLILS